MTASSPLPDTGLEEARNRFFGLMAEPIDFCHSKQVDFSPLHHINTEFSKRYMQLPRDPLWHYTSADGLIGIVNDRSIWLSSIFHMNDRSEMFHAFSEFHERARLICQETPEGKHQELFHRFFKRGMFYYAFMPFVVCFSSRGNLLSQWRAYGGSGDKFCLRFSGEDLLDVVRSSIGGLMTEENKLTDDDIVHGFVEVIYDDSTKSNIMDFFLRNFIEFIKVNDFDLTNGETMNALELYLAVMLLHFGVMFKDRHFAEEGEWRIYCLVRDDPNTINCLQGRQVKFRNSLYGITPYLDMRFGPRDAAGNYPLPIKEVLLGPHNDPARALRTLNYYLHQNGMGHVSSDFCQIPF